MLQRSEQFTVAALLVYQGDPDAALGGLEAIPAPSMEMVSAKIWQLLKMGFDKNAVLAGLGWPYDI